MDHDDPQGQVEIPQVNGARRKPLRLRASIVVLSLLFGGLVIAENDSTSVDSESAANRRRGRVSVSAFTKQFARPRGRLVSRPVQPAPKPANPGVSDEAAALAQGRAIGADANRQIDALARMAPSGSRSAAVSGQVTANQDFGFVCTLLLNIQARVALQIQLLINAFPQLTDRLLAIKAQVDARINALLIQFGCNISV